MPKLTPHIADIQAHYDLSEDFFRLFLDPTQSYSCAYFERDDMTLEEAQIAKIDLSLAHLDLQPGMTLLDIGCGWGATIKRAVERYDVDVVGLTLSRNQQAYAQRLLDETYSQRSRRVLLQRWEDFHEPVDRIVSIEAFEHFGRDRYDDFFKMSYEVLPADGVMVLHTIVVSGGEEMRDKGLPLTMSRVRLIKVITDEIYPGGRLPLASLVKERAAEAGYMATGERHLQPHYVRTLDTWSAALEAQKDEAVRIQSEEVYDRFMKYLTGCADLFREGYLDVCQFTLSKSELETSGGIDHRIDRKQSAEAPASDTQRTSAVDTYSSQPNIVSVNLGRNEIAQVSLPYISGRTLEVVLSESPSTGYEWELHELASIVNLIDDTYDDDDPLGADIIGGEVNRRFHFKITDVLASEGLSGRQELAFTLSRPWQPDDPPIAHARVVLQISLPDNKR